MSQNTNSELYRLALYLLSGFSAVIIAIIVWIVNTFKGNHEKHFEKGRDNSERIAKVEMDLSNLRHECERNHGGNK